MLNWTNNLEDLSTTPTQQSWLEEKGSITQRLRLTHPYLEVKILQEGYNHPSLDEQQILESLEEVWLREILIVSHEKPLIYARTLIPNFNKNNAWSQLEKLGTKPLGEILFNHPYLERTNFQFCHSNHWQIPNQFCTTQDPDKKLARRCSFYQNNQQLLLTEVFLEFVESESIYL